MPDRNRLVPLRFMVHQNILRNLHYAGIEIPVPAQEIRVRRGATVIPVTDCVVTEIGKEAMSKLLEARPELAGNLSHALARRQAANQRWMADTGPAAAEAAGLASQLLGRIRSFFNLGAAPAKNSGPAVRHHDRPAGGASKNGVSH